MRIICAWCGLVVRDGTLPASHTMCESCLTTQMEALDKTVSECPETPHSKVKSNL